MSNNELVALAEAWLEAEAEKQAIIQRMREVEGRLVKLVKKELGLSEAFEGTQALKVGPYEIKIAREIERGVDVTRLFEIALRNNLIKYLPSLFDWDVEVEKEKWLEADKCMGGSLESATMLKLRRLNFEITQNEEVSYDAR